MKKILFLIFITSLVCGQDEAAHAALCHTIDNLNCKDFIFLLSKTKLTQAQKQQLLERAQAQIKLREQIANSYVKSIPDLVRVITGTILMGLGTKFYIDSGNFESAKQKKAGSTSPKRNNVKKYMQVGVSWLHSVGSTSREDSWLSRFYDYDECVSSMKNMGYFVTGSLVTGGFWQLYRGITRASAQQKLKEAQAIHGCLAHMCS